MIYLVLCFFCTLYMYSIQRYKTSFFILLPPFIAYFLLSSLQYNVGSDYFSYIYIYNNQWVLPKYSDSGEYFFYYSNIILKYLDLPDQSIFFVFSFVQSVFIFYYFKELKKTGILLWLMFFIFLTVTNTLHNQMNLLRQYAALTLFPLISIFAFEKKYLKFFISVLIAMSFHSTAIIFLSLIVFRFFNKVLFNKYFLIFILSIPFYFIISKYTFVVMDYMGLRFTSYIDSEYFEKGDYITLLAKVYYLPAILYFFFLYGKRDVTKIQTDYFSFVILIFSCTYWSFLMSLDITILSRLFSYFWFFIVFPLYYVGVRLHRVSIYKLSFFILYIFIPYFAKVIFLAKNEFLYQSIIFN